MVPDLEGVNVDISATVEVDLHLVGRNADERGAHPEGRVVHDCGAKLSNNEGLAVDAVKFAFDVSDAQNSSFSRQLGRC